VKIVIAPDSFKESLSAGAVARSLALGLRRAIPDAECVLVPVADGGEGTVRALVEATGGKTRRKTVTGPLGDPVVATYGLLGNGDTAAIEMAAASGLELVPPARRNPLRTTSYGTGQLLRAASATGARKIIIGIGGSATCDGGAGMAQALGCRFLDGRGRVLPQGLSGGELGKVHRIDVEPVVPEIAAVSVVVACDVNNRLLGPLGAAAIYGPQKGASASQIRTLEKNLKHLAKLIRRDVGIPVTSVRGGGAAGGLGAGLIAFAGGELRGGAGIVLEAVGLERHLQDADVVITGEGRIDAQTAFGKAPAAVAALADSHGVPVIAVGGALADGAAHVFSSGIDALESAVARDMSLADALRDARPNLVRAGERIGRWLLLARRL